MNMMPEISLPLMRMLYKDRRISRCLERTKSKDSYSLRGDFKSWTEGKVSLISIYSIDEADSRSMLSGVAFRVRRHEDSPLVAKISLILSPVNS